MKAYFDRETGNVLKIDDTGAVLHSASGEKKTRFVPWLDEDGGIRRIIMELDGMYTVKELTKFRDFLNDAISLDALDDA